ncbi:unnamed protein product [Calypogeia fissa]
MVVDERWWWTSDGGWQMVSNSRRRRASNGDGEQWWRASKGTTSGALAPGGGGRVEQWRRASGRGCIVEVMNMNSVFVELRELGAQEIRRMGFAVWFCVLGAGPRASNGILSYSGAGVAIDREV